MSERQRIPNFEEEVRRAMRSYAEEGARAFDPGLISAQARSGGAWALWWWPRRTQPMVEVRTMRFALLVVLLGVALAALAAVGSGGVTPPPPVPGLLVTAPGDQVSVVDPRTGTSVPITAETLHDSFPVWSPDGTRIVISQHDGRGRLQLIDADGANRHALVGDMTSAHPAAWSPDGTRLAFAGYHYPGVGEPGLYIVGADGTNLTLLVPGNDLGRVAWSPDASMIAFADGRGGTGRSEVHVVDVASGRVTTVSTSTVDPVQDVALAWRPGGSELLYAQQAKQVGELRREDVVLAERVGNTWRERRLVSGILPSASTDFLPGAVTSPMWLDGDRYVYVRDDRMWVAAVDGRPELPIGDPALDSVVPGCVAPDGSMVAVVVADGGTEEQPNMALLLMSTAGGPTSRIQMGWTDIYGAACSWSASTGLH